MEYHSAMKRNGPVFHSTTWMNLKSNILSERSQSQKVPYYSTAFYDILRRSKLVMRNYYQWLPGVGEGLITKIA